MASNHPHWDNKLGDSSAFTPQEKHGSVNASLNVLKMPNSNVNNARLAKKISSPTHTRVPISRLQQEIPGTDDGY